LTHTDKPIFFAHANGFPGGSYTPLFEALKPYEVSFIDSISENVFEVKPRLRPLVARLEASIVERFSEPVIGVGHSLGGILMFFVAKKKPELFRHLILLDPPFFRPAKAYLVSHIRKLGLGNVVPVAAKAATRRNIFSSQEEAATYFAEKSLFRYAYPDTITHYVAHGLVREGDLWRLRIPPEFERAVYLNLPYRLEYPKLQVPSTFLYGQHHDVLSKKDIRWLKRYFSKTTFIEIPGSHMFPLEKPGLVAENIKGIIDSRI
jgi:pimeloyl-ACP methyl ester carboxylesterase